jgi:hypothetical protein
METFYQTRSLMHGAEVTAVAVSSEYLITGSADSTVKVPPLPAAAAAAAAGMR